jgi:hypothetical protein
MTPHDARRLAEVTDFEVWPGVTVASDQERRRPTRSSTPCRRTSGSSRTTRTVGRPPLTFPAAIKTLAIVVAARVWRNPSVATRVDVGPFTEMFSKTVDDALYLSDTDRAVIAKTIARPRVWTLATCRGEDYLDTVLVPVDGYTDPFPLDAWGNDPSGGGVDFGW